LIIANGRAILAALKNQTATIPIVFVFVLDPVADGFVSSLRRLGGNITGITNFEFAIAGKWLELLNEIAPRRSKFTFLFNPETAPHGHKLLKAVSSTVECVSAPVRKEIEIERAFAVATPNDGMIVVPDLYTSGHSKLIVRLAAEHRVPAIYPLRFFVDQGGLLAYGVDTLDLFRRLATFVDQILNGQKTSDLPVQAPTKFELVINLKTAKALGLTAPPSLQATADDVLE